MPGLQPAAEVELSSANQRTRAVAIFDSGSMLTTFGSDTALLLGIDDVTVGHAGRVTTLAGVRDVYLFDLDLQLVGIGQPFQAQVGFFPTPIPRNILGRIVFFSKFEIGFRDTTGDLHLREE